MRRAQRFGLTVVTLVAVLLGASDVLARHISIAAHLGWAAAILAFWGFFSGLIGWDG